MRKRRSRRIASAIIAALTLVVAGPLYGGEVLGGVYLAAGSAGLLSFVALGRLEVTRG